MATKGKRPGARPGTIVGAGARDVVIVLAIAAAAGVAAWLGYWETAPQILDVRTFDYWFDADAPAVAESMLDRYSNQHWRTNHHPLFPLLTIPGTIAARVLLHASRADAIGLVVAAIAALWAGGFFVTLRLAMLRRTDAAIFTALASSTAAAVFWFTTPETAGLSALCMLPALGLVAAKGSGRETPVWACIVAAALTLSVTITDGMVGLLMLVFVLPIRKAVAAGAASLGLVVVLSLVQRQLVPTAAFLLQMGNAESYLFNPLAKGPVAEIVSFLFHSVVLPLPEEAYGARLSVQGLTPGAGGVPTLVGVLVWVALLVGAGVAAVRHEMGRLATVLLLAITGQFALHLAFGIETFLYSAHFVPLLVAFVAVATRSSSRPVVIGLALVLMVVAGLSNSSRFLSSAQQLRQEYQKQHDFEVRLAELTPAEAILVYGQGAAAGEGSPRAGPPPEGPPGTITCYTAVPGATVDRSAWIVRYDHWSIDLFERYRQRGAQYFATADRWGLEQNPDLWAVMNQRYELVERTSRWVIYHLVSNR